MTFSNLTFEVRDALTGRAQPSTIRGCVVVDSSGALVWGGVNGVGAGDWFASSVLGADAHALQLADGPALSFCHFRFGVLTVDVGHGKYRIMRFDHVVATDAEPLHKMSDARRWH